MKFKTWKTVELGEKPNLKDVDISSYAQDMLDKIDFRVPKEKINLIKITVRELGFDNYATTEQIYSKAEEVGLELCPPQIGPILRAEYKGQPLREWLLIGMEQITDRYGSPRVFYLGLDEDGLWLGSDWAKPGREWGPGSGFVFCLRKSKLESLDSSTDSSLILGHLDILENEIKEIRKLCK